MRSSSGPEPTSVPGGEPQVTAGGSPGSVPPEAPRRASGSGGFLDLIERIGNALPEPSLLFVLLATLVILVSAVGSWSGWSVQTVQPRIKTEEKRDAQGQVVRDESGKPVVVQVKRPDGHPEIELVPAGAPVRPRNLLTSDGVYWMLSSMLRNFTHLPALGLIVVAILGIGLAEKFGYFSALMRLVALVTPRALLTPVIVFIGANSAVASDAGYVILPPLAAALFHAVGRHPVAGLAAAFAGVAGGFGGGFFPTGGDGALAGFAQDAARVIDGNYTVNILHNLFFKAGSAILITLVGWFVTDRIVEPRLVRNRPSGAEENDAEVVSGMSLDRGERRALFAALGANALVLAVFAVLILVPGFPLHGPGQPVLANGNALVQQPVSVSPAGAENAAKGPLLAREPVVVQEAPGPRRLVESPGARWSHVIVPIIFFSFLVPGMVYGWMTGALKTQKDLVEGLQHGLKALVPVLTILFFMAQFVNYFSWSRLDRMLAFGGGSLLVTASLPVEILLVLFVGVVITGDFAISGMLSKFGALAPIFVPMFMMAGISPELTTAAYRIGDSVVNIVTPLNSYQLLILMVLRKYQKDAGLGNLISLMVPYSIAFAIAWTGFLLLWYLFGIPLGPQAPLDFVPPS